MNNQGLQPALNQYFSQEKRVSLPWYQTRAIERYHQCRTSALGGHAQFCENGHLNGVWYNSCRTRGCPQCQSKATEQWLLNTQRLLLHCPHHHIIFTIPSELHLLWRYNKEIINNALFTASQNTLKQFSSDPRYLKATPGILTNLHTWGRNLSIHPHIHALISHGGLDEKGNWIKPRKKHLFPQKPLMMVFRGKLLALLRSKLNRGEITLPPDKNKQQIHTLLNFLGRKNWCVHCCPRYDTAKGVTKYLARYVRRGPVNKTQVRTYGEGTVRFSYRSHQTKKTERLTLPVNDFVARLAQHTPLPRKPSLRYSGLYSPSARSKLNLARKALGQSAVNEAQSLDWQTYLSHLGHEPRCQKCNGSLIAGWKAPEEILKH
jgi:hypothetical protein